MVRPDARILDDLARVAGGAAGLLGSARQQIREEVRARIEEMAAHMDLVPRSDMERLEVMVASLTKRIEALEGKKAPAQKPAPKKTVKKKK